MTQLGTPPTVGQSRKASNNIYTVLTLIAVVVLIAGVAIVTWRGHQLFGGWNPLKIIEVSR